MNLSNTVAATTGNIWWWALGIAALVGMVWWWAAASGSAHRTAGGPDSDHADRGNEGGDHAETDNPPPSGDGGGEG